MVILGFLVVACDDDDDGITGPSDPTNAPRAVIDRFSDQAGTLFRRSSLGTLPGPGQAIDLDQPPFITHGLGPAGERVRYYNFDVQPVDPAPIYVLYREGETQPVPGQLNIVEVIPGDATYNDFWQVVRVTVPRTYVANTITSLAEIVAGGYQMTMTNTLVNCPIVPEGSSGDEGGAADGLTRGWYRGQVVFYFNFGEAPLQTVGTSDVPTAPIFVTFNTNPDQPNGGPPSGFRTEAGTPQTHNVLSVLPGDAGYSPLWEVRPYNNNAFGNVRDLPTALAAPSFGSAELVNCPVVFVAEDGP
jgi:hypothetical protein